MSDRDKPEPSETTTRPEDPNPPVGSMPRIPTSEIKQPVGLLGRLGLAGSRTTGDDGGASAEADVAPGFHDDWVKTEPTGALAYTPEAVEVDESRPRTDHVLPSGSVDLPGSPDDRSKTEPDWDGVTPRTAEAPVVVPGKKTATTDSGSTADAASGRQAGTGKPADSAAADVAAKAAGASPARPKGQGRKTRPGWPVRPGRPSSRPAASSGFDGPAAPRTGTARKPNAWKIPAARRPKPTPAAPPTTSTVPIDPAVARVSNVLPPEARTSPQTAAQTVVPPTPTRPASPLPTVARAASKANPAARRMFSKIMQTESPPTQAFSIVDRLVGSPYANPTIQQPAEYDANARQTLEFALDLAESMFRFGAGALQAETSVIAVTASLGLRNVDVEITNQSIHINYAPQDQNPVSLLRVVRSWTGNYRGLARLHRLVSEIVAGGVTRTQAADRLHEILRQPKPFPRWMATAGGGGFTAAFVVFIGGNWLGALLGFLSFALITKIMNVVGAWRVPEFFTIGLGSAVTTAIAMLLWAVHAPISPAVVVAGGIMLLLPSSRFVSAVQDAINGFPVTAAGRFFSSLLIYGAIIAGITAALVAGAMMGMPRLDVANVAQIDYPKPFLVFLVVVAVICVGVFEQTSHSLVLPTAGVALAGYLAYLLAEQLGVGERLTPAVAAVVVGGFGRWVAMKMGAPQLVVAVPAVTFLLPGLMIFRAMYGITIDAGQVSVGLIQMFNAFTIILAIAGGVVLGDTVARPFTKGWITHERRRIRRR
ncbi:threonine/serine exporter family protein [Arthrobacter sp. JSM 101049]|uniref:threonine/serine ThrE exporter family protein n=1 Tax=Arthrobacter sp. JSM 101049 TaxID=929097 RepID=UPI003562F1C1